MTLTQEIDAIKSVTGDKLPHVIDVLAKIAARLPEPVSYAEVGPTKWRYFKDPCSLRIGRVCGTIDQLFHRQKWVAPVEISSLYREWTINDYSMRGWPELTPAEAAELTGDKSILPDTLPTGVAALHGAIPAEETDAEFLSQVEAENAKGKPGPVGRTIADMAREAAEDAVSKCHALSVGAAKHEVYFNGFVVPLVLEANRCRFILSSSNFAAAVASAAIDELVRRAEAVAATHKPQYKPFVSPDELRSIAAEMKGEK